MKKIDPKYFINENNVNYLPAIEEIVALVNIFCSFNI